LKPQLKQLLLLPEFKDLLQYEGRRKSNDRYITDVYDAPRWRELMGRITTGGNVNRIAVQLCVDGVEPFNYGNINDSVKPLQYCMLSLSPHLRYKPAYMLLQMLIPSTLKGKAAKKYYDWAANEMNDLHGTDYYYNLFEFFFLLLFPLHAENGVEGVRVVLYGTTLDTPGRRELLQMQVCLICF